MNDNDSQNGLHMTESQVRSAIAIIMVAVVFLCVISYHWGKKKACEEFIDTCKGDELSDKISLALCHINTEALPEDENSDVKKQDEDVAQGTPVIQQKVSEKLSQGILAGFGAQSSAQHYQKKLANRNIETKIIQKISKTSRGATRKWYQVITLPLPSSELQLLVKKLKAEDHLQNVQIIQCSEQATD